MYTGCELVLMFNQLVLLFPQVSTLCDVVYVVGDGGDPGVASIDIRSGEQVVRVPLRVWYPDVGMIIKLSDSRLNRIKGWFVPQR